MYKGLSDMILRRRSVRSYRPDAVDAETLAELETFLQGIPPLFSGVLTEMRVIPTAEASFLQKWRNPQFLTFYAEDTAGEAGLICTGFRYQLVDLFLQSRGLGSCWVGLGWPDAARHEPPADMKLACMMAFGHPDDVPERPGPAAFRRKEMNEISDVPDERLECVRLAPSATNSQPWFFVHEGETLHVFREKLALIRKRTHGRMNLIDMGIALAHLYVTNPESFRFEQREAHPEREGYLYVGSVRL